MAAASILAISMMLGGLAAAEASASTATITTWTSLNTDVTTSGTVTLGANITAPSTGNLVVPAGVTVTLDLDGYTLTITHPASTDAAIQVVGSLTIETTAGGDTGRLIAHGGTGGAGIGGGETGSGGTITVTGGKVTAQAGRYGAGIGGGKTGSGGTITVTGGKVTATGATSGSGIGGGLHGTGGTITVSGGTVTAQAGRGGAGIGGGTGASGGTITVTGGTVTARGDTKETGGAGIGGGESGSGGTIAINSGTVTATGAGAAAGIGGGTAAAGGTITITGGKVTAHGGTGGAGIGGGFAGAGGTITITGGKVTAHGVTPLGVTGVTDGAGIGGGWHGTGGAVTIRGGTITAYGGENAAGIGGGRLGAGGTIIVGGGAVTAVGDNGENTSATATDTGGAGIGGGTHGAGGTTTITGGTVHATAGGRDAAGIGGSWQETGGTITVGKGASVTATGGFNASAVGGGYTTHSQPVFSLHNAGALTLASVETVHVDDSATNAASGVITLEYGLEAGGTLANTGTVLLVATGFVTLGDTVTEHDYKVSFTANGHGTSPAGKTVYAQSFSAGGVPLPPGYVWATAPSGGTVVTATSDLTSLFGKSSTGATLVPLYAIATTTAGAPTVTITAPNALTYGSESSSTFTVTVAGTSGDGYPVGTITLSMGSTPEPVSCSASGTTATDTYACHFTSTTELAVGSRELEATFAPGSRSSSVSGYTYPAATSTPVTFDVVSIAPDRPAPQRIYGTDAIATSIAVATHEFSPGSAGSVVLARTTYFSDALAGGPLAAAMHAPLLLTEGAPISSSIDPRVLTEIQRMLPRGDTVYLLGGPLALSPTIDTTLDGLGYKTTRIAGTNEYSTAVDIAEALGNPTTVFETTALTFADSLSAGPAAIKTKGAILLTDGSTQAPQTASYLAQHPTDVRYAVGGPLAAYGADPTAIPVYGQTLFATSHAVAQRFFPGAHTFGIAAHWQDALSGGVYMGQEGGPMLIVPDHPPLPSSIASYLSRLSAPQGYVFGGPLAVPDSVVTAVRLAER